MSSSDFSFQNYQNRTEQNRTVSLLISGHIHDIEIQCEQQNVIYKGLGIFFPSKYKAAIQIGTLGCSHSLVSVVLIVERGGGGQPQYSQCYSLSNVSSSSLLYLLVIS